MRKRARKTWILALGTAMMLVLASCGGEGSKGGDVTPSSAGETAVSAQTSAGAGQASNGAASTDSSATSSASTDSHADVTSSDKTDADSSASLSVSENGGDAANESEGNEMMEAAKLYYQGHASMRITTAEGKVIYVDPFMGDGYDEPADLILETHGHYDHTQTKLIKNKNEGCETITWKESIKGGEHQTFDLGFVTVEAVEAGYNKNHNAKECVGFILTFSNGATLYLSGDTSKTPQMSELAERNLDYAFFCCDGVYNMNMKEAIECANLVAAKHSIPYHMVPANNSNGFDRTVAESFDVEDRIILAPGEELELTK